ncbi:MAG: tetratricopeptide repeat protein, partial [Pseudomonadota bacterium]
ARNSLNPGLEAGVLNNMGLAHRDTGKFPDAAECFNKSFQAFTALGNGKGQGTGLTNLGLVCKDMGDYAKAVEYQEKAIETALKTTDKSLEGAARHNLGVVYHKWGKYTQALDCYKKSLETYTLLGNSRYEAVNLMFIGELYKDRGQYGEAKDNIIKALNHFDRLGDVKRKGEALAAVAAVEQQTSNWPGALAALGDAAKSAASIGAPTNDIDALIAHIYMDMGKPEEAEPAARASGSPGVLGRLSLLKNDREGARDHFGELLKSAEKSNDANALFVACNGLGLAHEALEEFDKAEGLYGRAVSVTEEIRSSLVPSERREFFAVKVGGFPRDDPARNLTRVRMKRNRSVQSIDSSELARARTFADKMAERSEIGYCGATVDILEKEDRLITRLASLKSARNEIPQDRNPERHQNLGLEIDQAQREMDEFVQGLWKDYKAYASVKYPRPIKLGESGIRPEEYVVVFDLLGEGVGAKLIKGKTVMEIHFKQWPAQELEADVKKFRAPFEAYPPDLTAFDPELGKKLYKNLLSKVLADLPPKTPLIIVPDGILAVLPFEALVKDGTPQWGQEEGKTVLKGLTYLGDMHPVTYYQSITALTLARERKAQPKSAQDKILIIADPVFSPDDDRLRQEESVRTQELIKKLPDELMSFQKQMGFVFQRLPETGQLADALKELYKDGADVHTGLSASKSTLLKKTLNSYNRILFATHGYYGNDIPN